MAVYREGYKAIETIQSLTTRVFNDACDAGMPVEGIGTKSYGLVAMLCERYGDKETRKQDSGTTSIEVELIDEWAVSDERKTVKEATERFKVSYTNLKSWENKPYLNQAFKGKEVKGFISVEKIN